MTNQSIEMLNFEKEWIGLAKQICHAIYANPKIQKLKKTLNKNGFLTQEEISEFIDICDRIKYQEIYKKFGQEDSEGYKKFSVDWRDWFSTKGIGSAMERGQRNSVDHILFGSTPDPEEFLECFEKECLIEN